MLITVVQKNTRQAPRKVRLVANAVRKMPLEQAIKQLAVVEKKASLVLMKVLKQALANAWHNHGLRLEDLKLNNILIEAGPTYKRFNAVSRGRAHGIFKRSCHIRVILESKAAVQEPKPVTTTKTQVNNNQTTTQVKQATTGEVKSDKKLISAPIETKMPVVKDMKHMAVTDKKTQVKPHITRTKSFGGRS